MRASVYCSNSINAIFCGSSCNGFAFTPPHMTAGFHGVCKSCIRDAHHCSFSCSACSGVSIWSVSRMYLGMPPPCAISEAYLASTPAVTRRAPADSNGPTPRAPSVVDL